MRILHKGCVSKQGLRYNNEQGTEKEPFGKAQQKAEKIVDPFGAGELENFAQQPRHEGNEKHDSHENQNVGENGAQMAIDNKVQI